MEKQRTKTKTIIVWLDAGTFDVIMPMLDSGRLPAFQKVMAGGVSGTLISTIPPLTPPAWASFATGVNPGKHGVYDFCERRGSRTVPVTSYSIRRETLWTMLNEAGKKVILLNAPITYPPKNVNGIVVTGLMTPGNIPYVYPENFKEKFLKEFPEYLIHPRATSEWSWSQQRDEYPYLEEAHRLLGQRGDATLYLMDNYDWDLFVSYFYYTDQIQHKFWKYMDATHPAHNPGAPRELKEAIASSYEIVDDYIQKILKRIGEDTAVIVASDHGAGPIYKDVLINNYLKTIGIFSPSTEGAMRSTVDRFLEALDFRLPRVSRFVPGTHRTIFDKIRARANERKTKPSQFFKYIDWAQTRAHSSGTFGQIYVNHRVIKSTWEYEKLLRYLIQKLFELRDPEDGQKIVDNVYRKSQIYSGPYVDEAPDLILFMRKMTYITRAWWFSTDQTVEPSLASANHRMEGVLIMFGKNFRRGHTLTDCNIMDLTPTILYLMGVEVPSDLDGRVLLDAFHPSYARKHPVRVKKIAPAPIERERFELSKEEEEKLKERLKALGYM